MNKRNNFAEQYGWNYDENGIEELITLNFPKNMTIREPQMRSLKFLVRNFLDGKSHCVLELPTGVGKSLIAYTFAKIFKFLTIEKPYLGGTTVTTKTKALQEQYVREFNIPSLKGKENYPCYLDSSSVFKDVKCYKNMQKCSKELCSYISAVEKWRKNNIFRVNNFSMHITCPDRICIADEGGVYKSNILVIDECHEYPETVISSSTFELDIDKFNLNKVKFMQVNWNPLEEALQEMVGLIAEEESQIVTLSQKHLEKIIKFLEKEIKNFTEYVKGNPSNSSLAYLETISNFGRKLASLWGKRVVFYINDSLITIKPLSAKELAFKSLDFPFTIHMSATIGDMEFYSRELGIPSDEVAYYKESSPFPLENRKIIFKDIINFSYANRDKALDMMVEEVDRLLDIHLTKGELGIIHTSSYFQAEYIRDHSRHFESLRVPKNAQEVEMYKNSFTLISPSMHEGYDFKDDAARFQIMIKLPYPSLGDVYVKVKSSDELWYEKQTLNKFIQAYGRGIRHYDDWCVFYVLDGNFNRHLNSTIIPDYIKEAIRIENVNS